MMKRYSIAFLLAILSIFALVSCTSVPKNASTTLAAGVNPAKAGILPESSGWKLIWADEFDGSGLPNPDKWTHEEYPPYTYNNELQGYVTNVDNSRQEGGRLIIDALHGKDQEYEYTSARITTDMNFSFTYGRVEFRAKLPKGLGTWPALWMMPSNSMGHGKQWPDSGEIDVMETVGHEVGKSFATLHTAAYNHAIHTQRQGILTVSDMYDSFHVYAMEWYPDHITCFVDDNAYFTVNKAPDDVWQAWPFDLPFYIIMNVAVGGNWGGQQGVDPNAFPARMEVDYVRVYQNPSIAENTHKP